MAKDKVFVSVDERDVVIGFYPEAIYPVQPEGTREITFEAYLQLNTAPAQGKIMKVFQDGSCATVFPDPPPLTDICNSQCKRIDEAADAARLAVAGDPLRAAEYQLAEAEAKAYREAGYSEPVPRTVQSWADAKNWTAQQAADDILTVATAWNNALYTIRAVRLMAKENVRAAATADAASAVADAAISEINSLVEVLTAASI